MDAESEVSPAVIKKVLEWHALLGISPEDTRADVLSALAECGWKDDAGRTAEKALSDIGNASKTDADAVLALMAREAASGGLVSPALDGPVSAQPSAADVVEAALAGLPPDLLLSLRAISSARGVEADLRRTLAFFGQHRERLGMLSQGKLPANLLRLAANAAKDIQIQAIQMVAEDPQSADQLAAALALLPTLSTSVPLTAMLPLLPNQLACSVLLPELKKNLENSSNAERMLSLNKWTACGVLISFAEHEALREDAINLYLDLLSKEYEELGVEQGQKLKRKFVEELVKIAVLDGRSFRLLAEWSLSPAAESILQSELRTHMLLTFLSLFSSPPLPTLPFLIINLYKLHNFDPSSFGALLARSGLARSLKSVVVDDDWDAAVGKVEGEGKVDKEFGGKVKESVIY